MSRDSAKCRRICLDTHAVFNPAGRLVMACHVCGCVIDVMKDRTKWRADHIRRKADGGEDTAENLFPICIECDTGPDGKAADDTRQVAKAKRVSDNHRGARVSGRGFRKAPEGYNAWTRTIRRDEP